MGICSVQGGCPCGPPPSSSKPAAEPSPPSESEESELGMSGKIFFQKKSHLCVVCLCVFYLLFLILVHLYYFPTEIDNDGVIEPDTDAPQEMGDFENLEVLYSTKPCIVLEIIIYNRRYGRGVGFAFLTMAWKKALKLKS